ncbi:calcium-binding protein P-like [Salvelinus sp. IW2-2015]|uniref:calcium-binding protein P-like n=1 Tax=Salvelinus sp. IW2-2015 TaxID=2691554 RepID=UPI0038D511D4
MFESLCFTEGTVVLLHVQGGYPQVYPPHNPGMPGQPQWTGPPPQPCFNPGYPPRTLLYPPAQPPQWNGPPPNQPQYNPGVPPMGYAPGDVQRPSGKEEIKMENMSPADPLLAHPPPQVPPPASEALHSTDGAFQVNIDTGKNAPTNFL